MKKFSKEDIILLHKLLIEQYGGDNRIRDLELLDLSINSPYQTFDGNKRIGAHCLVILLDANNYPLSYSQGELIDVIMGIASSNLTENDLLEWVENHIKKSDLN
ncbi:type II toxin-antitoxin system death-on-curing family toxin [Anaerococcus sp. Marseille-Q5996]|uniref:type II toxin-antitoxin system death-on-curing family toxin n=1 Tax=Anaerococcus sp. Marseille-Q5996 TaxID=2972769 RepID=UPI0021C66E48|nr:Fic family protein [Anaerococcus sp. Marseille-Q5996]